MLNPTITEQVRKLSPSERIDLIEYTASLVKEDMTEQLENTSNGSSLAALALTIAEAGEEAMRNGAPELPSDFATNHDNYLYGKGMQ